MDDKTFFQHWNIAFAHREALTPAGSPNRSEERFVVMSDDGTRYIAEGFGLRKKQRQITQNCALEFFRANGMPGVFPYLRTADGFHGVELNGCFYQLRVWKDAETSGKMLRSNPEKFAISAAEYLLKLKEISALAALPPMPNERFVFGQYLLRLSAFTAQKMPQFTPALQKICAALDDFLKYERTLPPMLAHGDFHPGNILIRDEKIAAVIDWEFLGWKHPGYDLTLLLGCLGRDDISWLTGNAGAELQNRLYRADYMPDAAWEVLPQLMAAIRLGWLGEWIDLGDRDLAEQEIFYINYLLGA